MIRMFGSIIFCLQNLTFFFIYFLFFMIKTFFLYLGYVLATTVLTSVSYLNLAPQFGSNPSKKEIIEYEKLTNYENGIFINSEDTPLMTGKVSTWDFLKDDSIRKPENLKTEKIDNSFFLQLKDKDYQIAWLGHSSFLISIKDKIILLDPMLGSHASPISIPNLKRFNDELPINPESIPYIDFVLFSHDHYDHLDFSTVQKIKDKVKTFLVPLGIGSHLRSWDVDEKKIVEMNWEQSYKIFDLTFVCLPARHFSGRGPMNQNSTLWSSWAIKSSTLKIYFSGDSGYGIHFKKIGDKHGPFDISLIDCGQYNLAWKYSHMFPGQAVKAAIDLKSKYFMPIHWGGFILALHPWDEPVRESKKIAEEKGLSCLTPQIGEILSKTSLDKPFPLWWNNY